MNTLRAILIFSVLILCLFAPVQAYESYILVGTSDNIHDAIAQIDPVVDGTYWGVIY